MFKEFYCTTNYKFIGHENEEIFLDKISINLNHIVSLQTFITGWTTLRLLDGRTIYVPYDKEEFINKYLKKVD